MAIALEPVHQKSNKIREKNTSVDLNSYYLIYSTLSK